MPPLRLTVFLYFTVFHKGSISLVKAGAIVFFAPAAHYGSFGCGVDLRLEIWSKNGWKPKKQQDYQLKFSITAFEVNMNVKF